LVALGQKGLGKVVGPTCFCAFHLNQRGVQKFVGGLGLALFHNVRQLDEAAIDLSFVTGSPLSRKLLRFRRFLHDLVTHGFNGCARLSSVLQPQSWPCSSVDGSEVDKEENEEEAVKEWSSNPAPEETTQVVEFILSSKHGPVRRSFH